MSALKITAALIGVILLIPAAAGANEVQVNAAGLQINIPENWNQNPPSNSMRAAEAEIPGEGGPADFVVFYFGPGGGGGTEANILRWVRQMESDQEPVREEFEVGDLAVTWVDVQGTLLPSMMGKGPKVSQPNSRLYGAVIEGPGGPWFIKATGPDATLSSQREVFIDVLKSSEVL